MLIPSRETPARRQIVVVGGGAGGLELVVQLARKIDRRTEELVLVDRAASHLWKPRLHEVAAGLLDASDDEVSYLGLAQLHGFRFHYGPLAGLDTERRILRLGAVENPAGGLVLGPRELSYDDLVLAIGSRVNDFGISGVNEHCHMLDSPAQAAAFNRCFLDAALQISEGQRDSLTVGIVGAGATGVELAAELRHAVVELRRYGGLGIDSPLELILVDMTARVLADADVRISDYAQDRLTKLGVKLRLGETVSSVTSEGLHLKSGEIIPCDLKVWASGIVGLKIAEGLQGLQLERSKRIVTDAYGACVGVDHVYAMGDCAATPNQLAGSILPATAQVAHQQAGYLATALMRRRRGRPVKPFVYHPRGTLVSLGPVQATAELPGFRKNQRRISTHGAIPKLLYVSLQYMHRASIFGWPRAAAIGLSDLLRRTTAPPIKLH